MAAPLTAVTIGLFWVSLQPGYDGPRQDFIGAAMAIFAAAAIWLLFSGQWSVERWLVDTSLRGLPPLAIKAAIIALPVLIFVLAGFVFVPFHSPLWLAWAAIVGVGIAAMPERSPSSRQ